MKDLAILSLELVFLILASLEIPWQSICSRICLTLVIVNSEMVLREFLGLADLPRAQALHIHKMTEVIVIRKDENLMLAAFQVVTPSFEYLNNS